MLSCIVIVVIVTEVCWGMTLMQEVRTRAFPKQRSRRYAIPKGSYNLYAQGMGLV